MAGSRLFALVFAITCLATVPDRAARAQCRLCAAPTTTPGEQENGKPIELQIETSLNFDRLILSSPGEGFLTIRPDGSSSAHGAVEQVSARAMPGTATIRGEPGRAVRIELPRHITLYSLSGGELSFDQIESDLPSIPRLDSTGTLTFRFGGRLTVSGNAEGDYRGDLPITVDYL
jgi:hypothetical protein